MCSSPVAAPAGVVAEVCAVHVYPVKSLGGFRVAAGARWQVAAQGLAHDREWMVVGAGSGRFLSQRNVPSLAALRARLDLQGGVLRVTHAGQQGQQGQQPTPDAAAEGARAPSLCVPLAAPVEAAALRPVEVRVWEWRGKAHDEGDAAADWLNRALGDAKPEGGVRLVRHDIRLGERPLDGSFVGGANNGGTRFSDGFPALVASEESLAALNAALAEKGEPAVPMDRFRANVVIRGKGQPLAPYAEDGLLRFEAGGVRFVMVKPCARCTMPSVDQATGVPTGSREPLRTLTETRKGSMLGYTRKKMAGGGYFGANCVPELQAGAESSLGEGDTVTALEQGTWT